MLRSLAVVALVLAPACGDSVAHQSGSGTGEDVSTGTGASDSVSTTSGDEPTTGGTASTTLEPTGGTTGSTTGGSSGTTGPATNCYDGDIWAGSAESIAKMPERLAGHDCIAGWVRIGDGPSVDLSFLSEIRAIGGYFEIEGAHSLISLHGLEKLESVGGRVRIEDVPELADAGALAGLASVGAEFEVNTAPKLTALDLAALTTIGGDLRLSAPLASLSAAALTSVQGGLELADTALTSLAGLSGMTSIAWLRLHNNSKLVDLSGLTVVVQGDGYLDIEQNAALVGLDGLPGVTTLRWVGLRNNAALKSLAPLAGATLTEGLAIVGNPALGGLPPLHGTFMRLDISHSAALASLAGLEGVTVTDELTLLGNDALVDLKGLGGLADGASKVWIQDNAALANLDVQSAPASVGDVQILQNPKLTSLGLLKNVQSAASLSLYETNVQALPELAGLTNAEILYIEFNPALASLAGLEQLESVGTLWIRDNPTLTTLAALQGGALVEVLTEYNVRGNALPSCEAKALYDSLTAPPGQFCFDNEVDMCSGLGDCEDPIPP